MINWEIIEAKDVMIRFYKNWLAYKEKKAANGIIIGTNRWPLLWIPGGEDVAVEFIFDEPLVKWITERESKTKEEVERNFEQTNFKTPVCGLFFRVIEPKRATGILTECADFCTEHGAIQEVLVSSDPDNGKMATNLAEAEACFLGGGDLDYDPEKRNGIKVRACMGLPIVDNKARIFELPREKVIEMLRTVKANGYKYEDLPEFDYMKEYQKEIEKVLGESLD